MPQVWVAVKQFTFRNSRALHDTAEIYPSSLLECGYKAAVLVSRPSLQEVANRLNVQFYTTKEPHYSASFRTSYSLTSLHLAKTSLRLSAIPIWRPWGCLIQSQKCSYFVVSYRIWKLSGGTAMLSARHCMEPEDSAAAPLHARCSNVMAWIIYITWSPQIKRHFNYLHT